MGLGDYLSTAAGYAIGGPLGGLAGNYLGGGGNPGDMAGKGWDWLTGKPPVTFGNDDKNQLNGYLNQPGQGPYVGASPYQGGFNSLISQLQQQAMGNGPSLAGNAYNQASNQAMAQQSALARGGASAGAGRQAAMNMGAIGQGQAAGYGNARAQEELNAQSALTGALTAGNNADFQRQNANQDAWLQMMADKLGITKAQLAAMMGQKTNMEQIGGLVQGVGAAAGVVGK